MKFDHTVKYNGEYYPAGAEVPMPENKATANKTQKEAARKPAQTNKE